MTREVINEASTFSVDGVIQGTTSVGATPTTLEYRIYDVTNDRIVRDWTSLTPSASFTFDVSGQDNTVYGDSRKPKQRFEEREIIVSANRGTTFEHNEHERYLIRNLRGYDS